MQLFRNRKIVPTVYPKRTSRRRVSQLEVSSSRRLVWRLWSL